MEIIYFLIIGAISGWLAGQFWKGSGFGLLGNIVVGIIGGFLGGYIAGQTGLGGGGMLWQIIISAGGAWLLLFVISLLKK
ncbi:MAG: GlsB/YeaQ/YmgE family stress response membrane protein [Saprospiraceae bacterium]|nr:GlsB/YeaQ/YmgE family stress response membrane protein [Saprospiraceae bacterium]